MKIAIDIDDTLNERFKNDIKLGIKFCKENGLNYRKINMNEMEAKGMFGFSDEEQVKFMNLSFPRNVRESDVKPYAIIMIQKMVDLGIEVYIVTSRKPDYDKPNQPYKGTQMVSDTYDWIDRKNIPVPREKIIFGISDKGKYCKENGFDFMIDDSVNHIKECVENRVKCILMTQSYNESCLKTYKNNPYVFDGKNDWRVVFDIIYSEFQKR